MNKKFFTLIAGALVLAASFGTAKAQQIEPGYGHGSTDVIKITTYPNSDQKLYQLSAKTADYPSYSNTEFVLSVKENGVLDLDSLNTGTAVPYSGTYGESLWCLKNFGQEDQGQSPKVDFTNKAHGYNLAVSRSDVTDGPANARYGDLSGWGFSPTYLTGVIHEKPIYTYSAPDTVLVLGVAKRNNGGGSADSLIVIETEAKFIVGRTASDIANDGLDSVLVFTLMEPKELILTAEQFNTILGTQTAKAVKLTFDKDKTHGVNPWSENALVAKDAPTSGYLYFAKPKGNTTTPDSTQFLHVDTSYINTTGSKFLAFAFDSIAPNKSGGISLIKEQFEFKAEYNVANDSMAISVRTVRYEKQPGKNWADSDTTSFTSSTGADSLIVKLQDLVAGDNIRILTIGHVPAETAIRFNLSCNAVPPGSNLTSVDEDVYIIHNAAGQVLGVPIYTDSLNHAPQGAQWITYNPDNVNPLYIPAYQWVVKKSKTTNLGVSPINIINREFPNIRENSVQLYTDTKSDVFGGKVDGNSFKNPVPKAQKEDVYLGYYNIDEDAARLNSYDLNYYHNLSKDYFLGQGAADSTAVVKEAQTEYSFIPRPGGDRPYGYTVVAGTETIKDLKQLVRRAYVLKTGSKVFTINENERFALTSGNGDTAIFLLKTNNTTKVDGKHYYALLDTSASQIIYPNDYLKVGISDDNLWAYAQVQRETRTSAFAINEYSAPIYRRFDNGQYTYGDGQNKVTEPYGAPDNAPVWLKFTKQNNRNNEFLFENSPLGAGGPDGKTNEYRQDLKNKEISFLGLYNKAQYPEVDGKFNYTFYVDTAYSARGGQTSYTAKPQYMLAVRPDIRKPGMVWWQSGSAFWDAEDDKGNWKPEDYGKLDSAVILGLTRGYYVFNAQDSVYVGNKDYEGKVEYGAPNTTRLAFVDGVHRADTFYVLPSSYTNDPEITAARLQKDTALLFGLPEVYKHYLGENTHYVNRFTTTNRNTISTETIGSGASAVTRYVNGKSFVFQFRLVPGKNADRAFLIETAKPAAQREIGPDVAQWVKIQNGVPVISAPVDFYETTTGQNGSEVFNVTAGDTDKAVSNEAAPAVSAVKVVSEAGAVTILNAAGKKVAISNVLGQTVANAVLTSDNARVALPKGIVIVAVEGEAAIKAVVK